MAEDRHEKRASDARRDLDRVDRQGEVVGTSAFVRAAKSAGDHLSAAEAPKDDPIELWGRRIARGLALVFAVFLTWWLVVTYF